jgi:hypothetical protein
VVLGFSARFLARGGLVGVRDADSWYFGDENVWMHYVSADRGLEENSW